MLQLLLYKISKLTGISNDSAKYLSLGEDDKDNEHEIKITLLQTSGMF